MLKADMWDRARLARDTRFDGRFVMGGRTTRISCRPICPVKPAQSTHGFFFPSAAAAERAGFRPCVRCRPETAPETLAWHGAGATVSRGLPLMPAGFLAAHRVEALAEGLGRGARHLTRLFVQPGGAPPRMLARTRRVQMAQKL